jgi:hypothetical protein
MIKLEFVLTVNKTEVNSHGMGTLVGENYFSTLFNNAVNTNIA